MLFTPTILLFIGSFYLTDGSKASTLENCGLLDCTSTTSWNQRQITQGCLKVTLLAVLLVLTCCGNLATTCTLVTHRDGDISFLTIEIYKKLSELLVQVSLLVAGGNAGGGSGASVSFTLKLNMFASASCPHSLSGGQSIGRKLQRGGLLAKGFPTLKPLPIASYCRESWQ